MSAIPKNCHLWLPGLLVSRFRRAPRLEEGAHVYVCIADHFEPGWRGAPLDVQRERVDAWATEYPAIAASHKDCEGRPPQYTFFFPVEQYHPEHLDKLARLCHSGWGDVEIHLHHDGDTPEHLRVTLLDFANTLHSRHKLLRKDENGQISYGFIHGNWALNNSRPDGKWCGVDDETTVLLETGCFADFTMPAVPSPAQSRTVNSIYYALPQSKPKGHNAGPFARAGVTPPRGLLMIPGPLCLNWSDVKWGLLPRIDVGEIAADNPPTATRVRLWLNQRIHVQEASQHVFIKLFTHGAADRNLSQLLSRDLESLWSVIEDICRQDRLRLHYVTAYEMFQIVRGLETGVPVASSGMSAPSR